MESNYNSLETNILEISNGEVVKKRKNYYIPTFLMILGLWLIVFNNKNFSISGNENLTSILFFVGIIIFIAGVLFLFFQKELYIHKPSGKTMKRTQVYFNVNDIDKLKKLYAEGRFDEMSELKKNMDSGCIITFIGTTDGDIYYSQLLKYEPYTFVPCLDAAEHTTEVASKIKALIEAK